MPEAAGPQTVLAPAKPSPGQLLPAPLQSSATSHSPAEARHSNDAGRSASAGQPVEVAMQVSAVSQAPAEPRQTTALGVASAPQVPFVVPPALTLQA